MLIPTILIGVMLAGTMTGAFFKYRDTFHPALLLGPMIGFHYFYAPLVLQFNHGFTGYLTEDHVTKAQWVHLVGIMAMCAGLLMGGLQPRDAAPSASGVAVRYDRKTLLTGSVIFSGLGIVSFLYGVENVGGFSEAYGTAYGGGWIDSGWLRDLVLLCLPALMLFTLGERDRPITRRQLLLALPMIAPFLVHGLLGARRGPTFMTVAGVSMVYYMARQRRPTLPTLAIGGALLGFLLLVLVGNRGSIYLGSDLKVETDAQEYLREAEGNDYIYGAGLIIVTDELSDFAWGTTYLTTFLVRPIPRSIWPTKYEDAAAFFRRPTLTLNLGVDIQSYEAVLGWKATVGAAPGIIGDMWREFSWGMVLALFGLTWFYSHAWWKAVSDGGGWVPVYALAASLSLYLVMQTLEAMAYRFVFGAVPMLIVLRLAARKARVTDPATASGAPAVEPATVNTLAASS